ncbi:MAG: hypothetical protein ACE5HO_08245 [bacterium]
MQRLDPELTNWLLKHHRELGDVETARQLTPEILEQYESLVSSYCSLCHIDQHDHEWQFQWPHGRSTKGTEEAPLPGSAPFARLQRANPKKKEEVLSLLDDSIKKVQARFMPDFHLVHERWLARRRRQVLRQAQNTYGRFLRMDRTKPGSIAQFALKLLSFGVLAALLVALLLPGQVQRNKPGASNTVGLSKENQLNRNEQQFLTVWQAALQSDSEAELEAVAYLNRSLLQNIGTKLVRQSKQLQQAGQFADAKRRLAQAIEIAGVVSRLFNDHSLTEQIVNIGNGHRSL